MQVLSSVTSNATGMFTIDRAAGVCDFGGEGTCDAVPEHASVSVGIFPGGDDESHITVHVRLFCERHTNLSKQAFGHHCHPIVEHQLSRLIGALR